MFQVGYAKRCGGMADVNPYIEAWQLRDLIAKKEVKPREVAEFADRRIERLNPKLGAYMTPTPERAMADVARLEKAGAAEMAKLRSMASRTG